MTRHEAIKRILGMGGKILAVRFVKRTTGEVRTMICRREVKSYIKGEMGSGPAYDAKEHDLISVFDMHKRAYRCIPTEGIVALKVAGEWQEVS